MAAINFFQDFFEQLGKGVHHFGTDSLKIALTNTLPVNTQTSLDTVTNHPAPAAANGYSLTAVPDVQYVEAAGTGTLSGDPVVFTATAGGIGPFRYYILYNDSATSPADALIAWWDHASSVTLASGETFTIKFNNDDTDGTILTIASA